MWNSGFTKRWVSMGYIHCRCATDVIQQANYFDCLYFLFSKSTFFNVLTKASAPAENFPFCTIDPNENKSSQNIVLFSCTFFNFMIILFFPLRRVAVPDSRYDFLCEDWKPPSCVPAYLHVVDIAGLVKGAHEGQVS